MFLVWLRHAAGSGFGNQVPLLIRLHPPRWQDCVKTCSRIGAMSVERGDTLVKVSPRCGNHPDHRHAHEPAKQSRSHRQDHARSGARASHGKSRRPDSRSANAGSAAQATLGQQGLDLLRHPVSRTPARRHGAGVHASFFPGRSHCPVGGTPALLRMPPRRCHPVRRSLANGVRTCLSAQGRRDGRLPACRAACSDPNNEAAGYRRIAGWGHYLRRFAG